MEHLLSGKIAVITGVTSGIGRALATDLRQLNVHVIRIGRNRDSLAAVADETGLEAVVADLSCPDDIERCVHEVRERAPQFHMLINNAAECVYAGPLELEAHAWRRLVDVNLNAVVQLCSELTPHLAPNGDLVNIASVTADFIPNTRFAPYAVTKTALQAFTRAVRLELAPKGTRVTLISPGLVDTEIYEKVEGFERTLNKLKENVPDWLAAEDVAKAIRWALEQPPHVVVGELVLLPRGQAR